jgi:hypothetical protein
LVSIGDRAVPNLARALNGARSALDRAGSRLRAQMALIRKASGMTRSQVVGDWQTINSKAGGAGRKMTADVGEKWLGMRDAILRGNQDMLGDTRRKFGAIRQAALDVLAGLGFRGGKAQSVLSGKSAGRQAAGVNKSAGAAAGQAQQGAGATTRRARGGRLGGYGLSDTVRLPDGSLGAPRELVVNRHTEARVDSMLAERGTSLGREVAGERRPHASDPDRASAALGRRLGGPSVGDRGARHITVRMPSGRPGGAGTVSIGRIEVNNHGGGDARAEVESYFREFSRELAKRGE